MDMLQVCRRTRMRLFRDRLDVLVWGRWYWCPEGAKSVGFLSPFKSSRLLPDDTKGTVELGEVFEAQEITDGVGNQRYTGQGVCGDAEVWRNGILYADRGTPLRDWDGVPFCFPFAEAFASPFGSPVCFAPPSGGASLLVDRTAPDLRPPIRPVSRRSRTVFSLSVG